MLRPDGLLVLDSPNRLVTEFLDWSHGGHTVELSLDEITELVSLAGFEIISTAGIWRSDIDGRILQLEEGLDESATFTRRISTAHDAPDQSFIWWLNARRTDRPPTNHGWSAHEGAVRRALEHSDLPWLVPDARGRSPDDLDWRPRSVGATLPFLLKAGHIELAATLLSGNWNDLAGFRINIVAAGGHLLHRLSIADATRTDTELRWTIEQPTLSFATSIEVQVDAARSPAELKLPLYVNSDV